MVKREIDPRAIAHYEDWVGNNAAFTCTKCGKIFLVSGLLHKSGRVCPECGQTRAFVSGGQKSGGQACIEWDE